MADNFESKLCVVTGAGSGIGRALALNLAGKGAALALSDINVEALDETMSLIGADRSNRMRTDALDVSDPAAIEAYAARVRESLGPADYLFNIAGLSRIGSFADTPLSSFEKVMDVNFWGVVRMAKAFLPQLIQTKGGVINISSLFGIVAVPGQTHYCASKFAVRGFSESLASELEAEGVRVTSVHPGGVKTNIAKSAIIDALPEGSTRDDVNARFDKIAITSAPRAAETILKGAAKGSRQVLVGPDAQVISFVQRLFPKRYPKIMRLLSGEPLI
jgi:short-subunit dehydrogenase